MRYSILLILFIFVKSYSQNPQSRNLKKIETDYVNIVFCAEMQNEAQRLANIIDRLAYYTSKDFSIVKHRKIDVLLNNHASISNGFVQLMPRFSGMYASPNPDNKTVGYIDWLSKLSIHEYRHVMQYQRLNRNTTKVASVFGDVGRGALMYWSVPRWYFEGDAILHETLYTNSGRGRIPMFTMPMIAIADNHGMLNYDQAYLGSFDTYFPNHYYLGYVMTSYLRKKFGVEKFEKILEHTTIHSYSPFTLSMALKRHTGRNLKETYKDAMTDFHKYWEVNIKPDTVTKLNYNKTAASKVWTNYVSVHKYGEKLYALKYGLSDYNTIVEIDSDGNEKEIKGIVNNYFSMTKNIISWSNVNYSVRWKDVAYSDIYVYNADIDKVKKITRNSRYFSPAVSNDLTKIVATEYTIKGENKLVLLSINGDIIQEFKIGDNNIVRHPTWGKDDKSIIFTSNKYNKLSLSKLNIETGEVTNLIDDVKSNISNPKVYKNYVFYNADVKGTGKIIAYNMTTGKEYEIITSKYGAYYPSVDANGVLHTSVYTKGGFKPVEIKLGNKNYLELKGDKNYSNYYFNDIKVRNKTYDLFDKDSLPNKKYKVKSYSRLINSVRPHSLFIMNSSMESNRYDYYIKSNNILGNTAIELGGSYNRNTGDNTFLARYKYSGLWPEIIASFEYGYEGFSLYREFLGSKIMKPEYIPKIGINIPLKYYDNSRVTSIDIGAYYSHNKISYDTLPKINIKPIDAEYGVVNYQFKLFNTYGRSVRDYNPRYAQLIFLNYKKTTGDSRISGELFGVNASFFFPGVVKHHSLNLKASYEKQNYESFRFASYSFYPRGYSFINSDEIKTMSVNYFVPLLYPDCNFFSFFNLKRLSLNLFHDYGKGTAKTYDLYRIEKEISGKVPYSSAYNLHSSGMELIFEFNLFRTKVDLITGYRGSFKWNDHSFKNEFIILGIRY